MGKFKPKMGMGEGGLTLVEVLAALVILSIVFVGFMLIFPQMTTFNKKTGTKLETMNVARQEIVDIQIPTYKKPLNEDDIKSNISPDENTVITLVNLHNNKLRVSYTKNNHDYEADFDKSEDLSGNTALYKVHLKVMIDGKVNSETYGYIEAMD
ncbi:type IV pilus modification PilV family protein [Sporosarcina sp. FSL K6-1508]|uniref:type IV pilus modification PilV family protein n=1 Tax=Sporosarcina sp. FSL K6-1508 TaxID=2921553 RepID=UPI0030F60667